MSHPQVEIKNAMPPSLNHPLAGKPDVSTPGFEYEPLQDPQHQIRLLEICAADDPHEAINIKLWHADWNTKPRYIALSYTWGRPTESSPLEWDDATITKEILVNGCRFDVRPNLFHALSTIRPALGGEAVFWIDAICINQTDLTEKSIQVQRMKHVYQDSCTAMVWLGPADESVPDAYRKIKHVSQSWQRRPQALKNLLLPVPDRHKTDYLSICIEELGGHESIKSWDSVRVLLNRNWWRRAWVFQEICAAPAAFVMAGPCAFAWEDLVNVSNVVSQHLFSLNLQRQLPMPEIHNFIPMLFTATSSLRSIQQLNELHKSLTRAGSGLPLEQILHTLRTTHATDARDKVFAGLGLSSQAQSFAVDYRQTVEETFTRVAHYSMDTQKDLRILGFCRQSSRMPGLPSWVPDWTDQSVQHILPFSLPFEGTEQALFKAGGWRDRVEITVNEDQGQIRVEAAVLDKVVFLACRPHRQHTFNEAAQHPGEITNELIEASSAWSRGRGQQDIDVVFQGEWLRQWAVHQERTLHTYENISQGDWRYDRSVGDGQFSELTYTPTRESLLEAYHRTLCTDTVGSIRSQTVGRADRTATIASQFGNATELLMASFGPIHDRVLAVTESGYLALVPEDTEADDLICIVPGNAVPLALRPTDEGMCVIGECYVHGAMDGEAYRDLREQDCFDEVILI